MKNAIECPSRTAAPFGSISGIAVPSLVAFDQPGVVHAHPVDRRVEALEVGGALQAEDQRLHV